MQPPRKDLTHGTGQSDLFWQRYPDHCELRRPEGVFGPLDLSDTVGAIRAQRKVPTPPLDADVYDAMLCTECGDLNCRCPDSRRIRPMHFQGYEKSTLKRVCPAAAFEFDCQGRSERYRLGKVTAGAKSRVVRTEVGADNLRQRPALPPSTSKRKRLYRKRSAMDRINSKVADGFMLHSHDLRGKQSMGLKITVSMTVMPAAVNLAMQLNRPEQTRSLALSLAA